MDLLSTIIETIILLFTFLCLYLIISYVTFKIKSKRKKESFYSSKIDYELFSGSDYYEMLNKPLEDEQHLLKRKKFSVINEKEFTSSLN